VFVVDINKINTSRPIAHKILLTEGFSVESVVGVKIVRSFLRLFNGNCKKINLIVGIIFGRVCYRASRMFKKCLINFVINNIYKQASAQIKSTNVRRTISFVCAFNCNQYLQILSVTYTSRQIVRTRFVIMVVLRLTHCRHTHNTVHSGKWLQNFSLESIHVTIKLCTFWMWRPKISNVIIYTCLLSLLVTDNQGMMGRRADILNYTYR
jgi:hypothetical protein